MFSPLYIGFLLGISSEEEVDSLSALLNGYTLALVKVTSRVTIHRPYIVWAIGDSARVFSSAEIVQTVMDAYTFDIN